MYGNFLFEIYIKFPTFWYLNFIKGLTENGVNIITKKKRQIKDFLPDGRARPEKKVFSIYFLKF